MKFSSLVKTPLIFDTIIKYLADINIAKLDKNKYDINFFILIFYLSISLIDSWNSSYIILYFVFQAQSLMYSENN